MSQEPMTLAMLEDALRGLARETQGALAMSVATQFMLMTMIDEFSETRADREALLTRIVEKMENPPLSYQQGPHPALLGASMAAEALRDAASRMRAMYGLPPAAAREQHS